MFHFGKGILIGVMSKRKKDLLVNLLYIYKCFKYGVTEDTKFAHSLIGKTQKMLACFYHYFEHLFEKDFVLLYC